MLLSKGEESAAEGLGYCGQKKTTALQCNTLSRRTPSTHLNHIMQDSSSERNWTPARRSRYRNSFLDTRWITQAVAYIKHNLKIAIWRWASFNYATVWSQRQKNILVQSWSNFSVTGLFLLEFHMHFKKLKLQRFFCQTHQNKGAEARSRHASVNRLCLGRTLGMCGWCLILMCLWIPDWTGQVLPRKKQKQIYYTKNLHFRNRHCCFKTNRHTSHWLSHLQHAP